MQSSDTHLRDTALVLLGAALGAGLAAILTPRNGSETRDKLHATLHHYKHKLHDAASDLSDEAKQELNEARDDVAGPDRLARVNKLEEGLGE